MPKLFTDDQIAAAHGYDLIAYLHQRGYGLVKKGNSVQLRDHDSFVISNNKWCWNSQLRPNGKKPGGDVVAFAMYYENMGYVDAVKTVLSCAGQPVPDPNYLDALQKKNDRKFYVPYRNADNETAFDYLTGERGIDPDIVQALMRQGLIYESMKYHNVVFVGKDERGVIRNIFMRSTDGSGLKLEVPKSDKAYSFRLMGTSPTAYVFEGAIDALSHATMFKLCGRDWRLDSRISMGGVEACTLEKVLEQTRHITEIVFCTDNDKPGKAASEKLSGVYRERGYTVRTLLPVRKDFNKDLTDGENRIRRRERERGLSLVRGAMPGR